MASLNFFHQIEKCNQYKMDDYLKWFYENNQIGWINESLSEQLKQWPDVFDVKESSVNLLLYQKSIDEKTKILDGIIKELIQTGHINRYHNEPYPIVMEQREKVVAIIDRASAAFFGIKAFGQHINGYVVKDGEIYMWIAKRAKDKMNFPNKLDHIVAGGLPFGISLEDNLIKECKEEAGMPEHIARKAKPVGIITYLRESSEGLRPDTIYTYDLKLDKDFTPKPNDGEVESFKLMPVEQVMELVANTDEIKLNCNLVLIDFFIRHGLINPDHSEYIKLVGALRSL